MPKIKRHKQLEVHLFPDKKSWMKWLSKNFGKEEGIWIKLGKKKSGVASITYEEGREGAIIYGWIDGLINACDDKHYLTKFTPRRRRSNWSKINRKIAEDLIISKKMKPSGLAQVKAAKSDGRWEAAYDSPKTIKAPTALLKLIESNETALANYENLSSANRYAFLYRIQNAKREQTKIKHINIAYEMLKKGEVYHPHLQKPRKKK